MILEINHAEVPSCADCRKWTYLPSQGWKIQMRLGQPLPRRGPSPCGVCPKGPTPFTNEPTQMTLLTIDYFHLCAADNAGLLPRDRRVIENNALIGRVREQARRGGSDVIPLLAALLGARKK